MIQENGIEAPVTKKRAPKPPSVGGCFHPTRRSCIAYSEFLQPPMLCFGENLDAHCDCQRIGKSIMSGLSIIESNFNKTPRHKMSLTSFHMRQLWQSRSRGYLPTRSCPSRNKPADEMAFPHPQSRKNHQRNKDIPGEWSVIWNFVKRAVDITDDRNTQYDVTPAKHPPRYARLRHAD